MDDRLLAELIDRQDHVFTRTQVFACGGDANLVRRRVRRRDWIVVHPGVLVDHTGPLTRSQEEWAAVLYYAPAVLTGRCALRRYGVRTGRDSTPGTAMIDIAVERSRRVGCLPGVRVTRVADWDGRTLTHLSPPLMRLEHVVLDLAAQSDEVRAVAVLADAVQSRRTTAARLLDALDGRPRLRHRRLLRRLLGDVVTGTHSVLEWLYLTRVERRHWLPTARRQRPITSGRRRAYRDVEYLDQDVIVELDGRLGHELSLDRWDDLDRDVDSSVTGRMTIRVGWRQCLDPCRTASAIGHILMARGLRDRPTPCSATCAVNGLWSLDASG